MCHILPPQLPYFLPPLYSGPSSRMSSHRGLNSAKSKVSVDQAAEKSERAKSLENIMTTRKMDNEIARGKSPLHGWDNDGERDEDLSVKGELIRKKSFHEDQITAGVNDSASVKNAGGDGNVEDTVDDEFDKPDRADGRQNPEDVVNTDNNVVAVDDDNKDDKNEDEKVDEENENWKIRKSEEEEFKERLDQKVDEKDDDTKKEDNKEKDVVQEEGVDNSDQQEAAGQLSVDGKVEEEVSDEKANEENKDET
ncbi:high mobility group nucleosome-binding domain-containing protein 5-like [Ylistrum balloti]|uniref:high mobility group nucleosome-binding domain-containing protein 5-like n=1 Tax=Ylistrum balloti TaxID=509963 RepID=UPI002905949F|nr:high mobility group nucleosome-binding domain-containing protein 5-like [Ylistrum balloti]